MAQQAVEALKMGDCEVDLDALVVRRSDMGEQRLTALEGAFLRYLAGAAGRVVTHEEALQEVWGYRAGVKSRAVSLLAGRLRKKIEVDPSEPRYLLTAYGVGFRLEIPEDEEEDGGALFGRQEERQALRAWLRAGESVMQVVGPGGVGKSHLVQHVLGVQGLFVDLHRSRELVDIQRALLTALGAAVSDEPDVRDKQINAALRRQERRLVVLDGVEGCAAALASAVPGWLAALPGLQIVLTTRHRVELEVSSLLRLGPLSMLAAREMLRSCLSAHGVDDDELLANEEALLAALDGLPLAIELAASRAASMGLAQLMARLDDPLAVLQEVGGDARRQRGLRAVLEVSWAALTVEEQKELGLLAVFDRGFSTDAAQHLLQAGGYTEEAEAVLQRLADTSWLTRAEERPERWSLRETVRRFALARSPEVHAQAQEAHRSYYLKLGEALVGRLDGRGSRGALALLEQERPNLQAARRGASPVDHLRLGLVLTATALRSGALTEGDEDWTSLAQVDDPLMVATAEANAARLACMRGAYDLAATGLQAARAAWVRDAGTTRRLAAGLRVEGEMWLATAEVQVYQGHYGGAVRSGQQALALFRAANDRGGQGRACERIASGMRRRGSHTSAIQYSKDAAAHLEAVGNDRVRARVLGTLGASYYELGRLDQAAEAYRGADALFSGLGAPVEHARCQLNAAMLAVARRRLDEARALLEPALETHQRVGDHLGESTAWQAMARVLVEEEDYLAAEDALGRARHLAEQVGLPRQEAAARRLLGWIHHRVGRRRRARLAYDAAAATFRELDALGELGLTLLWSSLLLHHEGQIDEADGMQDEAMRLLSAVESPLAPLSAGEDEDSAILAESFQARRTWDLLQLATEDADEDPVTRARRRHGRRGFLRSVLPLRSTVP